MEGLLISRSMVRSHLGSPINQSLAPPTARALFLGRGGRHHARSPAVAERADERASGPKIALCLRRAACNVVSVEQVCGIEGEAVLAEVIVKCGVEQHDGWNLKRVGLIAEAPADISNAGAEADAGQRTALNP